MVSLVNVENSLDNKNMPVGHELKVLKTLQTVFESEVELLAGKEYIRRLDRKKVILPYCVHSGSREITSIKILCNYFISLIMARGNVLIYIDMPEALLWGIALCKSKKKVVTITYLEWNKYREKYISGNPIRQFLVKRGLKRLDGCIVTNSVYKPEVPYIRTADYYITEEIKKYQNKKKMQGCVCLGEIRAEKDVEGLVKVMRKTPFFLLIAGSFPDKNTYRKIRGIQSKNIKIENRNLPYNIYLNYLSMYKYVVLPYDKQYYSIKTSGILLEGIFLGAIPIAPKSLLEQEGIQGLGYCTLSDIPELIGQYERGEITVHNDLERYRFERYKEKVIDFIKKINSYS